VERVVAQDGLSISEAFEGFQTAHHRLSAAIAAVGVQS
jgi:hypothetical protein